MNANRAPIILLSAIVSVALYAVLALSGDLRQRLPLWLLSHTVLTGLMFLVFWNLRERPGRLRWVLVAALAFRLVAALGPPALSDDVYRYVWDGRVQLHGIHPYRYAPDDPALEELRDENWQRINHPSLRTIYPPVAEATFLALATLGAGPTGFRLVFGLVDFGVVLLLGRLLSRLGYPRHRLVLYAWNPLAVMETAGSGHLEPLGSLLLLLAATWIIGGRPGLSTTAIAAAVHVKLLPLVLLPGWIRRVGARSLGWLIPALSLPLVPLAWAGPALGGGLLDYAARWERNAVIFPAVLGIWERLDPTPRLKQVVAALQQRVGEGTVPWDWVYRHVWPQDLARLTVGILALAWIVWVLRRRQATPQEWLAVLGGVLLLSPTMHPWYLLWLLPWAAALASPGWLCFAALVPLAYTSGTEELSWPLRIVEYGLPLIVALAWRRRHRADGDKMRR